MEIHKLNKSHVNLPIYQWQDTLEVYMAINLHLVHIHRLANDIRSQIVYERVER